MLRELTFGAVGFALGVVAGGFMFLVGLKEEHPLVYEELLHQFEEDRK